MGTNPTIYLRLPEDVLSWLRHRAVDQHVNPGAVVEQLLRREMARPTRVNFEMGRVNG